MAVFESSMCLDLSSADLIPVDLPEPSLRQDCLRDFYITIAAISQQGSASCSLSNIVRHKRQKWVTDSGFSSLARHLHVSSVEPLRGCPFRQVIYPRFLSLRGISTGSPPCNRCVIHSGHSTQNVVLYATPNGGNKRSPSNRLDTHTLRRQPCQEKSFLDDLA